MAATATAPSEPEVPVPTPTPIADFDPAVARAVTLVLRRAGIPATVVGDGGEGGEEEVTVVVPDDRRAEALATMAASMEAIAAEQLRPVPRAALAATEDDEDEDGSPLVFERLRSLGFLPVLLVPLMVVTLAQVRLPGAYIAALIVGGMALLLAWRDGRRRRDGG